MKSTKKVQGKVKFLYNTKHEITDVQMPYPMYLEFIEQKRSNIIENAVPEWEVGYDILCASINDLREKGMTLASIAEKLAVKQPYLSKLLRARRQLKPDTIHKYLKILDELDSLIKPGQSHN